MNNEFKLYSDGGARGNPGPGGIGAVIIDQSGKKFYFSEYIGQSTNNQAEYKALILGLEKAIEMDAKEINCYLDSELVVKQLKREYKIKDIQLQQLFLKAYNLTQKFVKISFFHIPREYNKEADQLVNEALDAHMS